MDNLPEKVDKEELEDMALALSDAGWTYREIAQELGISKNSVKPMKERAINRIPIPNREEIQRLNIRVTNKVMSDIAARLDDPNLPITATNVPNLYQNLLKALRAQTEALGYVGTGAAARELGIGIGESVIDFIKRAEDTGDLDAIGEDHTKRHDDWIARGEEEDVHMTDLELDPSDGVYKLRSEFEGNA